MPKQKATETKTEKPLTEENAVDINEIREMVAREAYLRAEERGFNGGDPVQDWLEAEKKVNEILELRS